MNKKSEIKTDNQKLTNSDLIKLGKRIRELRIKKGYTNYEYFAYDNDLPRAQYGKWEKGRNITYLNLLKIIRALDISLEEFFSEGFKE